MAQASAPMTALHDETALAENITEFIDHFLDTRFINLPGDWRNALFDVCLEMFHAGAEFSDNTSEREGKSIILN